LSTAIRAFGSAARMPAAYGADVDHHQLDCVAERCCLLGEPFAHAAAGTAR
jgi:hypothetical protein